MRAVGWGALWGAVLVLGCASAQEDPEGCAEGTECGPGRICIDGACVIRSRDQRPPVRPRDQGGVDALPTPDSGPRPDLRPRDAEPTDGPRPDAAVDGAVDQALAPDGAPPACRTGEREDCGRAVGICRLGTRVCGEDGVFGPCEGGVEPEPEVCNNIDDDCNGITDDGFQVGEPCEGRGVCGIGVLECAGPVATRCSTEPGGSAAQDRAERCDGLDNDCDGRVDEGFGLGEACVGACGAGVRECEADGPFAQCSSDPGGSQGEVRLEICDGLDNDCDGAVDEGFEVGGACVGVGACGPGVFLCGPEGRICSSDPGGPADGSSPERCNGLDDDCDGAVDEGLGVGAPCEAPGLCGAGRQECGPAGALRCDVGPGGSASRVAAEICDGLDNDCDGVADEGLGVGAACPALGICPAGEQECADDGSLRCDTRPGGSRDASEPESCNDLDDDCDGAVDEGLDGGEICGGAVCGPELPVLSLGQTRTGDTRGLSGDVAGSTCVADTVGPDQFLGLTVAAAAHVIGVAPLDAAFDPVFWLAAGCGSLGQCVASLHSGRQEPGRPKARRANLPAGTYTVVVDGRGGAGGRYAVSAAVAAAGERCATAISLPVPGRFVGTLDGRLNDHAGLNCPANLLTNGADQAFSFLLAAPATVRVRLLPSQEWMPAVYLVSDCEAVDQTCAGSGRAPQPGQPVEFTAALGVGRWYVVVERPEAQAAGGEFLLELSLD